MPRSIGRYNPRFPFLFQRRVQPGPRFSKDQLKDWLSAVVQHRPGEADERARAVAALTKDELEDVVVGFERGAVRLPVGPARTDIIKRAAILHTDIAMMADIASSRPDMVSPSARASLHFGAALELVDVLRREGPKGQDDPFVLAWWRTVAVVLAERQETVTAPFFMERGVSQFPRDAEIILMGGALRELLASPWIQDGPEGEYIRELHGSEAENLRRAESYYRDALKINPGLVEARVRLGHVLQQQRRHELAIAELQRTPDDQGPPPLRFFRYMFLGEAQEGLNRIDAARDAYEHALELYPGAQSACLALGRIERRIGNRAAAVAAIDRLLERPPIEQGREDPWRQYFTAGLVHRAAEMLDELRAPFTRQP
jgi:tetratricopeptide (TPR) repeat protein